MSKPIARANDMHVCPMNEGGKPHVGGPILLGGNSTVLAEGIPISVVGDNCSCAGAPDSIIVGSSSVMIGNKPVARIGDSTAHGGSIVVGCTSILVGG